MSFKIYTKTGDKGTTSLYTGDRISKDDNRFECLGSIDEVNANLGLAREHCISLQGLDPVVHQQLEEIQARLIDLGSHVATPPTSKKIGAEKKIQHTAFDNENVDALEKWIDNLDE
jgi:cob(I)alamin adenosyltransferase